MAQSIKDAEARLTGETDTTTARYAELQAELRAQQALVEGLEDEARVQESLSPARERAQQQ